MLAQESVHGAVETDSNQTKKNARGVAQKGFQQGQQKLHMNALLASQAQNVVIFLRPLFNSLPKNPD